VTLLERYKRLTLWNKIGVLGSICSIAGIALFFMFRDKSETVPSINQTMVNSPGSMQAGHDININKDRRINDITENKIIKVLKYDSCVLTVGTISFGEGTQFAEDILRVARGAGCKTFGVNHGVGFASFSGVKILYPNQNSPVSVIKELHTILNEAGFKVSIELGSNVVPGSIYIYVGHRG